MISYDSYVRKIKKVKTVKNTIHRFRVLIISILCAASAATTGFLVSKGAVTQNVRLPETIVYGETYGISEAKVLFSKVKYQFATQGEDNWSKEKPTLPGDYSVRVVTEKSFNTPGYGKPVDFTILPKPVDLEIISSSVVYGSDPTINTDFLVGDDKIESIGFEYDDILAEVTKVKVDTDKLVIKNSDGQDITAFYNITAKESVVAINKKQLVIEPVLDSKTYDGLSIDYDNEVKASTINGLVEGDELQLVTTIKDETGRVLDSMPTNAGKYTLSVDKEKTKIINKETQRDMTSVYSIIYKTISFEIYKRELIISPLPFDDKVYDGVSYSYVDEYNNFVYLNDDNGENRLVDGESFKVEVNYSSLKGYQEALNADSYTMDIVSFIAATNTNLDNYKITTQAQSFEIEKRNVSLLPIDLGNKVYDGIEYVYLDDFNNFDYQEETNEVNKLVDGESIKVIIYISNNKYTNMLNAGNYILSIADVVAFENTLLDNYNFELLTRELVISKREVVIDLLNINPENNKIYDGEAVDFDESNYEVTSELKMVEGENLSFVIGFGGQETIVNAGVYEVDALTYDIENGLIDNYNIVFEGYNYEIKPRPINIIIKELDEVNKVYDGQYTSHDNTWDYEEGSMTMVDGETLSVLVGFEGSKGVEYEIKNADNYLVRVTDFIVENGLEANYDFSATSYEYLIEKRDIKIRPFNFGEDDEQYSTSNNKVYDGLTYSYDNMTLNNFFVVEGSIVEGEGINVKVEVNAVEIKNAGTYTLSILEGSYSPDYYTDLNNYNIILDDEEVQFIIEKRELVLKANNSYLYQEGTGFQTYGNEQTYNNEMLSYYVDSFNFNTVGEYSTLDEEHISVEVALYKEDTLVDFVKDAGEYKLVVNNVIFSEGVLSENYEIVISDDVETYLVTPRLITISLENIEKETKTYDGIEVAYSTKANNFLLQEGTTLAPLDELLVTTVLKDEEGRTIDFAKDVGIYTWSFVEITGINTDVNNYQVSFFEDVDTSTFEITRREVTIDLYKVDEIYSHIYDGTYFDLNLVSFKVSSELGMVDNETLTVNVTIDGLEKVKDAGTYYVYVVNNAANSEDVVDDYIVTNGKRSNYEFNTNGFEYVIDKRNVTIRANTFNTLDKEIYKNQEVYNGESYTYDNESFGNFTVTEGNFVSIPEQGIEENIRVIVDIYDDKEDIYDSIKNVGQYKMIIRENEYTPNDQTLLDNYEIDIAEVDVTFEIYQRSVRLDLFDIIVGNNPTNTKVYDGLEVEFNEIYAQGWDYHAETKYLMVDGEILTIDVKFDGLDSIKNVKEIDGKVEAYTVYVNEYFVENGLVSNYDFHTDEKEFTIYPREITIRPYNIDKEEEKSTLVYNSEVYDGTYYHYEYDNNNFVILEGSIVENEIIRVYTDVNCVDWDVMMYGIINAGRYVISINKNTIEFENTLKENYIINCDETVTFEILKRKVTLSVNDLIFNSTGEVNEKIYDGYYQEHNTGYTDLGIEYSLLASEPLSATVGFKNVATEEFLYEIKNAGEYLATIRLEDMSLPAGYYLSNYEFTINELLVVINKRTVSLKLDRFTDTIYEGETYVYNPEAYDDSKSTLRVVDGESLLLDVRFNEKESAKDVDTYLVAISSLEGNETGKEDGIKVVNGLRSNYIFTVDSYEFTISKRQISIRPFNFDYSEELGYYSYYSTAYNEEVYNGLTYVYSQGFGNFTYVEGSLEVVEGENLRVDVTRLGDNINLPIKDVGHYSLGITKVEGDSSTNINNYEISYDSVIDFVITPRPITIAPKNINQTNSKPYDAVAVTYKQAYGNYDVVSGSVVDGEDFKVTVVFDNLESIVDVKEGGYSYWISAIEGNKNTLLTNYDIDMATVKNYLITPRPITIIASNKYIIDLETESSIKKHEVEYNGHYYEYEVDYNNFGYVGDSLKVVGNDKFIVTVSINEEAAHKFKDADIYNFAITSVVAQEGTKASNYDINHVSVYTFEITARELTIRPYNFDYEEKVSIAYENDEQYNGYTYVYSTDWNNFVETENTVVEGEQIKVKVLFNNSSSLEVKDAKKYLISIVKDDYEYGLTTKASNYNITLDTKYVMFEVKPREVDVQLDSLKNKDYDGKTVDYDETKYTLPEQGMVQGEKLVIDVAFKDKETEESTSTVVDAGNYEVLIVDYVVENGKYENYDFSQVNIQTYIISPIKLTITPDLANGKEYDGKEVSYSYCVEKNFVISSGAFVEGEAIGVQVLFNEYDVDYTSVTNAGTYTAWIASYVGYGNYKDKNYQITFVSKEYKITPRKVTLSLNKLIYGNDGTWTYDGTSFDIDNTYTDVNSRICNDDDIILEIGFTNKAIEDSYYEHIKDAGTYGAVYKGYKVNGTTELNKNYDLTVLGVEDINLVISKRDVVVVLDDINEGNTHPYNKQYLAFDNSKFQTVGTMAKGEELEIYVKFKYLEDEEITASIIDAGTYEVFVSRYTVVGGSLDNYNFSQEGIYTYEITKRNVYMTLANYPDGIYNGQPVNTSGSYYATYPQDLENTWFFPGDDYIPYNVSFMNKETNEISDSVVDVGTYSVIREPVENDAFVIRNYNVVISNADEIALNQEFTIKPRDITITVTTVYESGDYGDVNYSYYDVEYEISEKDKNILQTHSIGMSVLFNGLSYAEIKNAGTYLVTLNEQDFTIYRYVDGENATKNFNYEILGLDQEFKIYKRQITIEITNPKGRSEITYDGKVHKEEVIISNMANNEDRKIDVKTSTFRITLDTDEKSPFYYPVDDVVEWGYEEEAKNVGLYSAELLYIDWKEVDKDNYIFDINTDLVNNVLFKITPKAITIAPTTSKSFYYGEGTYTAQNKYKVVSGSFVGKDGIEVVTRLQDDVVSETGNIIERQVAKDAGTYKEKIESYKALPGTNINNYSITVEAAEFEIIPRLIYIKPIDKLVSYDGEIYEYGTDVGNFEFYEFWNIDTSTNSLIGDEQLYIKRIKYFDYQTGNYTYTPIDIGTYSMQIEEVGMVSGKVSNYQIEYISGELVIGKPFVSIALDDSFGAVYDGTVYSITNEWHYTPTWLDGNYYYLPEGYTLVLDNVFVSWNYGETYSYSISEPGSYSVDYSNYKIYDKEGNDATDEFTFMVYETYVSIEYRRMHIKPVYTEKVYDGVDLVAPNDQYEIVDFYTAAGGVNYYEEDILQWYFYDSNTVTLLEGHHIRIETSKVLDTPSKAVTNEIIYYEIYDDYGNIIQSSETGNVYYEIYYNVDQLKIPEYVSNSYKNKIKKAYQQTIKLEKRYVSVTAEDINMTYGSDYTPIFSVNTAYGENVGLLPGHRIESFISALNTKDPGVYEVNVRYYVYDENNGKVTSCYDVENSRKIILDIAPKLIIITVGSAVVQFDPLNPDYEFTYSEFTISEEDRLFLEERDLLIDCVISGFISKPGVAINTIKNPEKDVLVYKVLSEKHEKIKDYTNCFTFEIKDGQLVMYE